MACRARGCPARIRLRQARPQRPGVRARRVAGTRAGHSSLSAQSRRVAHTVPQHDVVLAGHYPGSCGRAAQTPATLSARSGELVLTSTTSAIALGGKAELDVFLAAHPDIQSVQIMITDP